MSQLNKLQIFKISNRLELFESEEKTVLEQQDSNLQYIYFVIQGQLQYGTQEINKEQSFGFDLIYPKNNTNL